MKTPKLTYIFFLVLIALLATSCGNEQPILNDINSPFVIYEISKYNDTHSSYCNSMDGSGSTRNKPFGSGFARIVLPTGMYNIGDTIIINKRTTK